MLPGSSQVDAQAPGDLFLTAISVAEILYGIACLPESGH
jgi:predicted nucleic acid-binding protein